MSATTTTYTFGGINLMTAVRAVERDSLDLSEPGRIRFKLVIMGTSADNRQSLLSDIVRTLDAAKVAESVGKSVTFDIQRRTSQPASYDVYGGTITPVRVEVGAQIQTVAVELLCYPYARSAPYTVTVPGTLTGAAAEFLLTGVPGDAPALLHIESTDVSTAGVIQRQRIAMLPGGMTSLSAYNAWQATTALGGATSVSDSGSVGGAYATRTLTGLSHADIARVVLPSSDYHRGRFDGYARVLATGTAIGTPTALTGVASPGSPTLNSPTIQAPTFTSETTEIAEATVRATSTPTVRGTLAHAASPKGDPTYTASWSTSLQSGDAAYLLLFYTTQNPGNYATITGYTKMFTRQLDGGTGSGARYIALYYRNSGSSQSSVSVAFFDTIASSFIVGVGIDGVASAPLAGLDVGGPARDITLSVGNTTIPNQLGVILAASGAMSGAGGQYTTRVANGAGYVGSRLFADIGMATGGTVSTETLETGAGVLLLFSPTSSTTPAQTETTTDYNEPTPGELAPGTYAGYVQSVDADGYRSLVSTARTASVAAYRSAATWSWGSIGTAESYVLTVVNNGVYYEFETAATSFQLTALPDAGRALRSFATQSVTARVRALDAANHAGNATASVTDTGLLTSGKLAYSWGSVSNAVAYELFLSVGARVYRTVTTDTAYNLVTFDGLDQVSALPATSGALAPAPFIRAQVMTANDHVKSSIEEVATDGSGAWRLVRVFSDQPLPPTDALLSGEWPNGAVEVQGRSANGASATVRIGGLWIVASREAQVEATIHNLAHATKRRYVLEAHRSGRGVIGWLENISTGVESGRAISTGTLTAQPGNSIGSIALEQAAGLSDLVNAGVVLNVTVYPRWNWEAS